MTGVKFEKCSLEVILSRMFAKYSAHKSAQIGKDYKDRIAILVKFYLFGNIILNFIIKRRYVREHKDLALSPDEDDDEGESENVTDDINDSNASGTQRQAKKRKAVSEKQSQAGNKGRKASFWKSVDAFLKCLVEKNGTNSGSAEWQRYLQ